jgi:Flp pilus assembly protein TadD
MGVAGASGNRRSIVDEEATQGSAGATQSETQRAGALAGEPEARLFADDRARLARALDEYVAAQRFNADCPEAQAALGTLYAVRGRDAEAAAAYRRAPALDPTFVQAAINLADLQRALAREGEAERTLREAIERAAQSVPAHHTEPAREHARLLRELDRENRDFARLAAELGVGR